MGNFDSMTVRISIAVIAMSILGLATMTNAWSYRIVEQLEDAYELELDDIKLPARLTGLVSFTPCNGCALLTLRVTPETTYSIDEIEMTLADFLNAAEVIRLSADADDFTGVGVFSDVESQYVTRLKLYRY